MSEVRPISCSTGLYKGITKILANKLLPSLVTILSQNQTAFLPKRSISENVLLAQEIVRDYHQD